MLSSSALTRKPDSASAKALAAKGVELAKGSLDDKDSLVKALQGVSAAFLVTSPGGPGGAKAEEKEGKTFIDAAKEVKLGHLVFSSVEGADRKTGIPHFDSKWAIEEYLRASGIQHTILRPVAFYDNFPKHTGLSSFFLFGVFEAALCGKKLQFVACSDIGSSPRCSSANSLTASLSQASSLPRRSRIQGSTPDARSVSPAITSR